MRVFFWVHPSPPLSSTICYLLTRLKSPLFYYPGFQRIFFSDRYFTAKPLRASLTRLRREVSIRKKYPLEPRVLFYLIKSKSSDQDARCSIYDKFLHFITYLVDFFIQGQISKLITARQPRASTVLKKSAFSWSPISGGSST